LRFAGRWLYIPFMQDETPNSVEVPVERLRRVEAATYARKRLGQSVKVNTLRSWPIPYRQIGRDAVYEISDLDRFIAARLAAAPLRRAPGSHQMGPPDLAAVYAERFRLIVPDLGPDEGRLRAFEHTVGVCRNHYRVDLETAKKMVSDAIEAARARETV
jgi:hypothetical protein